MIILNKYVVIRTSGYELYNYIAMGLFFHDFSISPMGSSMGSIAGAAVKIRSFDWRRGPVGMRHASELMVVHEG